MRLQATLGGKLKGSAVQYHSNVAPEEGEQLYTEFCRQVEQAGAGPVSSGQFGARQVLNMETQGPYSHVFDI